MASTDTPRHDSGSENGHAPSNRVPEKGVRRATEPPRRSLAPGELWTELPPETQTAPRDDRTPSATKDLIFLFGLLSHRRKGCNRIAMFREGPRTHYLVQGRDGRFLYPMTGLPAGPKDEWVPCGNMKMGTVMKHAKDFWQFRRTVKALGREHCAFSLFVDRQCLVRDGKVVPTTVAKATVRWPGWALDGGDDRICDHLDTLTFMDVDSWKVPTSYAAIAVCPLDGPVPFISGLCRTPSWSLDDLCVPGKEWRYTLCPKCLGAFAVIFDWPT